MLSSRDSQTNCSAAHRKFPTQVGQKLNCDKSECFVTFLQFPSLASVPSFQQHYLLRDPTFFSFPRAVQDDFSFSSFPNHLYYVKVKRSCVTIACNLVFCCVKIGSAPFSNVWLDKKHPVPANKILHGKKVTFKVVLKKKTFQQSDRGDGKERMFGKTGLSPSPEQLSTCYLRTLHSIAPPVVHSGWIYS